MTKENEERRNRARIIKSIRSADQALRERYPFLNHQDSIGLAITVGGAVGMVVVSLAYLQGWISAWIAVPINAFLASLLHEVEHDLMHELYFRNSRCMQNIMYSIVWSFRGNTLSPWARKSLHLNHHKASGRPNDVEERLIGNGMPMGWKRILTMVDQPLSLLINMRQMWRDAPQIFNVGGLLVGSFPVQFVFQTLWYVFLGSTLAVVGSHVLSALHLPVYSMPSWLPQLHEKLVPIAVIWLLPNFIRQASLQIMSSSMHYYGNVDGVTQQTQILTAWYLFPLQIFCCNFGSTHSIHHFVVNQPFYLRQMVASAVHPVMKECGILENDIASNFRANSFLTNPVQS
jgi:fatty acid desaturase